jgi:hypothetical protein
MSDSKNSDDELEPVSKSNIKDSPKASGHDSEKLKDAINIVYDNICLAQSKTAAFTMMDCRNTKESRDVLLKSVEKYKDGMASFGEEEVKAINTLIQGANVQQQQKPAVFTFDGSIDILEKLELVQEWVRENRSPSQKLKEAKEIKARGKKR